MARVAVPPLSAHERLRRLLALVPWVAAHDGPLVSEVCARFGSTEAELVDDLNLLFMCGLHPYTPDALIDVDVADERVWIRYADYFAKPLRLTPTEGAALLASARALLATPGSDPDSPLARALDKLESAIGAGSAGALDVSLSYAPAAVLQTLREAAGAHRRLDIEYYTFGRDDMTRRKVDPHSVFSAGGQWYLSAYCHAVEDERLFRIDRVRSAIMLEERFEAPAEQPAFSLYEAGPDDPRVVIELSPDARWVAEQYPIEESEELGGGGLRVRLAVSETAWLERLLLRLGPDGRVVDGDAGVGRAAACRLLARYAEPGGDSGGGGHSL